MTEIHAHKHTCIRMQFAAQRQQGKRHRDIAQDLGLSEGQLLAAHIAAPPEARLHARALAPAWLDLVAALHHLGPVMALTRNHACVHEVIGRYPASAAADGTVQGDDFALHLNDRTWAHGFAVTETSDQGVQRSLQFFDASGQALHKVVLQPASDGVAYADLLERFASTQTPVFSAAPASLSPLLLPLDAQPVDTAGVQRLLEAAAAQALALCIGVANPGVAQWRSAPVQRIAVMGPWLNVLDPGFNLHLRQDLIASAWLVAQAGQLALQLLDAQGAPIVSVQEAAVPAGAHAPSSQPASAAWQALTQCLAQEYSA